MVNKITAKKPDNEMKPLTAIGLMSGTSIDAIDLAVIESNGGENISFGPSGSVAYTMAERGLLDNAMQKARTCVGPVPLTGAFAEAAGLVTQKHAYAVKTFLKEHE
ncbi:MAG: anhydro-N-acetylmuramic acid kinase, partial [Pseudomonadota bacterium]|nr:anhydro-N-acetylmuramic acid kinase [Pseudomonadota bacterium]